jgi:dTDP-4-dehydrorhamnose 3,5-epimerase
MVPAPPAFQPHGPVDVQSLDIPDLLLITPKRHGDDRGFFSEVWRDDIFRRHAGDVRFVQDNHSVSAVPGTLRGLHFQRPPTAQGKLVRVARGAVLDVAVDIRQGSPTYGRHAAVTLSAANWRQLWVPPGFLHGFLTLEPDTEVLYKVTSLYSPADDGGVAHDDPDLAIAWPVPPHQRTLSAKDRALPRLRDLPPVFAAGGEGSR